MSGLCLLVPCICAQGLPALQLEPALLVQPCPCVPVQCWGGSEQHLLWPPHCFTADVTVCTTALLLLPELLDGTEPACGKSSLFQRSKAAPRVQLRMFPAAAHCSPGSGPCLRACTTRSGLTARGQACLSSAAGDCSPGGRACIPALPTGCLHDTRRHGGPPGHGGCRSRGCRGACVSG